MDNLFGEHVANAFDYTINCYQTIDDTDALETFLRTSQQHVNGYQTEIQSMPGRAVNRTELSMPGNVHGNSGPTNVRRQPMVVWLRQKIDDPGVPGVEWIDEERRIFLVVWRHISSKVWIKPDGQIFKVIVI